MTERRGSTPMAMPMNTCRALVSRCHEQKTAGLRSTRASQRPYFSRLGCAPSGWQCPSPGPVRAQRVSWCELAYVSKSSQRAAHLCNCNQADTQVVRISKLGVLCFRQLWLSLV